MTRRPRLLCLLIISAAGLSAQQAPAQAPPAQAPPAQQQAPEQLKEPAYVRRFSAGLSLTFDVYSPLSDMKEDIVTTSPARELKTQPEPKRRTLGYGVQAQLMVSERAGIHIDFQAKKVEYHNLHVLLIGTDNPNTIIDDRPGINYDETTRARFFDIPVQFRFYNKDRHEEGHRLFFQAGPVVRFTRKVKTHIIIDETGKDRTYDDTPAAFKDKIYGVTGGGGAQFIDPFGIRVVPEVRYIRWFGNVIDSYHARSRRDQIECVLSLTF